MITIGADPEFQLVKDNIFISAHDLVPGTKRKPHPLSGGGVQADGTAVEICIEPAKTRDEFATNISTVLAEVRKLIPKDYVFSFKPSVTFPQEYFDSLPPQAKEIGCDPDFVTLNPFEPRRIPMRRGTLCAYGGHIHVGWGSGFDVRNKSHLFDCGRVAFAFGTTFKYFADVFDTDKSRATIYGQGNAFRPKPYGVELRAPSNAWLKEPRLWPWVFDLAEFTIKGMMDSSITGDEYIRLDQAYYAAKLPASRAKVMEKLYSDKWDKFPKSFPWDIYQQQEAQGGRRVL